MGNLYKVLMLASILSLVAPTALASGVSAGKVSGTVTVVGTRAKTEGAKSDKDVVIYLERTDGKAYPQPPAEPAIIDQSKLVFIPHVLPIQKGATVKFLNSDTTEHNIFCVDECCKLVESINAKKPKFLDLGIFQGGAQASHVFTVSGEAVILCKLHPEMAAYIVVLDTPYFSVAEINGETQTATFAVDNIPPGKYVAKVWNKRFESPAQEIEIIEGNNVDLTFDLQRKVRRRNTRK